MTIYLFWGEDEFLMARAVKQLRSQVVSKEWEGFNYTQYPPNSKDSIGQAFADIITPPIGLGGRLVHLPNSTLLGACSQEMLEQLEQVLPIKLTTNALLITSSHKPDGRNKSVKLLLKYAKIREFALIPQWQTDGLVNQVRSFAAEVGLTLTTDGCQQLAQSVGNNTQLLASELEKLKLYANGARIDARAVKALVQPSATNSLQLANAIRIGSAAAALELLENLLSYNEPALKIVATLVTSFRRWLVVKLCVTNGWKDDSAIASLADVKNPKQLHFIRQEIANVPLDRLQNAMEVLLQLELMLKTGWEEKLALQTQIVKLCI